MDVMCYVIIVRLHGGKKLLSRKTTVVNPQSVRDARQILYAVGEAHRHYANGHNRERNGTQNNRRKHLRAICGLALFLLAVHAPHQYE